jgi:hypothetical protein
MIVLDIVEVPLLLDRLKHVLKRANDHHVAAQRNP